MPKPDYLSLLRNGSESWNAWRKRHSTQVLDLAKLDLSGYDLTGFDLAGADLSNANLRQARLRNASLKGAELSNTNLEHALLSEADFRNAVFVSVRLSHCNFVSARLQQATFQGCEAHGSSFDDARLENAVFVSSSLGDARFTGANLFHCKFDKCFMQSTDFNESDLSEAELTECDLSFSHLSGSVLYKATIRKSLLSFCRMSYCDFRMSRINETSFMNSDLSGSDFKESDLSGSDLRCCMCVDVDFRKANLSGCSIFGISVWRAALDSTNQNDLIVTQTDESPITVDSIEVAQFIHIIMNNRNIRRVIDTIATKMVLIIGRFTEERKNILEHIKVELRQRGIIPVMFDFERPATRDLTETIATLAHLARFVIADITDARSVPQELMAIVPHLPSVPVQFLIHQDYEIFGMVEHFLRYPSVLGLYSYRCKKDLSGDALNMLIDRALKKAAELAPLYQSMERSIYFDHAKYYDINLTPDPCELNKYYDKIAKLKETVRAIEAYWDGDSSGWFVVLVAIAEVKGSTERHYVEADISTFQGKSGDFRLFSGQGFVPRRRAGPTQWPEAEEAYAYGRALAEKLSVPFYFPAYIKPSDNYPRWWDAQPSR
jgi:uncharacterized protein YjbI with pentapeptide repeats